MSTYLFLLFFVMLILVVFENIPFINLNSKYFSLKKPNYIFTLPFIFLFVILGLFSALRFGVGVDYFSYIIHIERISLGLPSYMEIGFQYLVKIIMFITNDPKLVIALASLITVFYFISAVFYQSKDVRFSIFLFLTWGYYFFTFNTIRNYLALSIVFASIIYLFDRKYFKFLLMVVFASLFHKSALICIPLYFLANRKFSYKEYIIIFFISIFLLIMKDFIREIAFLFYPHYEGSVYDAGRISVLNVLRSSVVLMYTLFYFKKIKLDQKLNTYFNLNLFSLIIYTSLYWLPEVSRIGFYFNIFSIVLIPNLTILIKRKDKNLIRYFIYLLSIILFFLLLKSFYNPTIKLLPYDFWFFS